MNAGATPKLTMSASESSCPPRVDVAFASRATEPSTASKNMPVKMSRPATVRLDQPKTWVGPTSFIA
jgi:hypothetical protein